MARKFFLVCAGMFLLALSYHLGAGTATAQAPSNSIVAVIGTPRFDTIVYTANGDVYSSPSGGLGTSPWTQQQNIFSGAPVQSLKQSWGQVKARFQGPATSGTNDR
jgi:hypothetical protein